MNGRRKAERTNKPWSDRGGCGRARQEHHLSEDVPKQVLT